MVGCLVGMLWVLDMYAKSWDWLGNDDFDDWMFIGTNWVMNLYVTLWGWLGDDDFDGWMLIEMNWVMDLCVWNHKVEHVMFGMMNSCYWPNGWIHEMRVYDGSLWEIMCMSCVWVNRCISDMQLVWMNGLDEFWKNWKD